MKKFLFSIVISFLAAGCMPTMFLAGATAGGLFYTINATTVLSLKTSSLNPRQNRYFLTKNHSL